MDYLEIIGTAIGLVYLWLEYHANVWLWVASIAMPAIYLEVYYSAGLYADFAISIYYLLASIYGLFCWLRSRKGRKADSPGESSDSSRAGIVSLPHSLYLPVIGVSVALWGIIGWLLATFTDSNVPWADGFTTALSIVAMWMLAKKYTQQWIMWILADAGCSILYIYKDLYFTSFLYALYAIIAIFGFRKWKRLESSEN